MKDARYNRFEAQGLLDSQKDYCIFCCDYPAVANSNFKITCSRKSSSAFLLWNQWLLRRAFSSGSMWTSMRGVSYIRDECRKCICPNSCACGSRLCETWNHPDVHKLGNFFLSSLSTRSFEHLDLNITEVHYFNNLIELFYCAS